MKIQTQVLVIGGGLTGAGALRDLALRGIDAVLVERRDLNAGASGANHGLLHSGGRYAVNDPESAAECVRENAILKRIASGCIEDCGGLFIGLPGDPDSFAADFLASAERIGLAATVMDPKDALESEPLINPDLTAAIRVPDASINPFMATVANLEAAQQLGGQVFFETQVISMEREGGRIVRVEAIQQRTGKVLEIEADQVLSAAGPWVDQIGALAGVDIPVAYSKGSLLITNSRLTDGVINRLRPPSDGDIVVPGETVTITGTTSIRVSNLDHLTTSCAEVDLLVESASALIPRLIDTRFIRVYAGVRPLVLQKDGADDRTLKRTFSVFDHEDDGLGNLATVTGGKLTTYRLMAEKAVDLVSERLGVSVRCTSAEVPLPGSEQDHSLDVADRLQGLRTPPPGGEVLCECEMIGRRQVETVVDQLILEQHPVTPNAIRLRSRLGMGSCQGGFCGFRTIGMLYENGVVNGRRGNEMLIEFLEKRWHGIKPVLWGDQLVQEQLLEAIYCGTLNIDGSQ